MPSSIDNAKMHFPSQSVPHEEVAVCNWGKKANVWKGLEVPGSASPICSVFRGQSYRSTDTVCRLPFTESHVYSQVCMLLQCYGPVKYSCVESTCRSVYQYLLKVPSMLHTHFIGAVSGQWGAALHITVGSVWVGKWLQLDTTDCKTLNVQQATSTARSSSTAGWVGSWKALPRKLTSWIR